MADFLQQHIHNGIDQPRINATDLVNNSSEHIIVHTLINLEPTSSDNWLTPFFIATAPIEITDFRIRYLLASTGGTLNFEKISDTQGQNEGTTILTSAIDVSQTAKTVYVGTISSANATLTTNQALVLRPAGTPYSLKGLTVQVTYRVL